MTMSNCSVATVTVQCGSLERFFDFLVPGPEVKYTLPSVHTMPTGTTCGAPVGTQTRNSSVEVDEMP
jgi:hypothetical protein